MDTTWFTNTQVRSIHVLLLSIYLITYWHLVGAVGYVMATMRRNQEALQYTDAALEGMLSIYEPDNFQVKRLYERKVFVLQQLGRHSEALEVMKLAGIEQPQASENPMHGQVGLDMGAILGAMMGQQQQSHQQSSQQQQQAGGGVGGLGAAFAMLSMLQGGTGGVPQGQDPCAMAQTAWTSGQHEKALQLISQGIERRAAEYGTFSEQAVEPIFDRAQFYLTLGRYTEAQADHTRGLQMMGKIHGVNHSETQTWRKSIEKLYTDVGMVFGNVAASDVEAPAVAVAVAVPAAEEEKTLCSKLSATTKRTEEV
jgi:tetratricopeptide (TPR) repeat protein